MRIARPIAAVAKIRVEIEEIGKNHAAVREILQGFERGIEMRHIARPLDFLARKTMRENIAYFADRHVFPRRGREPFKQIARRRRETKILAARSADEAVARVAFKGPRDDAADVERIAEAPRNAAEIIKPLAAKDRFMRSDLQNRIGGGVA